VARKLFITINPSRRSHAARARQEIWLAKGDISSLESGEKKNPGIQTLKKLARALGVPVGNCWNERKEAIAGRITQA